MPTVLKRSAAAVVTVVGVVDEPVVLLEAEEVQDVWMFWLVTFDMRGPISTVPPHAAIGDLVTQPLSHLPISPTCMLLLVFMTWSGVNAAVKDVLFGMNMTGVVMLIKVAAWMPCSVEIRFTRKDVLGDMT